MAKAGPKVVKPKAGTEEPIVELTRALVWWTRVMGASAAAAVLVSVFQWKAINDGAPDTKKLVQANMDMAAGIKAQAVNTGKLVDAANRSAIAAQDSANATKDQAAGSLKLSSIQAEAAKAQRLAANAELAGHRPNIVIASLSVSGFKDKPRADGSVVTPLTIRFANSGQSVLTTSGGLVRMLFADRLPNARPSENFIRFGGFDGALPPGGSFGPVKPIPYEASAAEVSDVMSGRKTVFVFGEVNYMDNNHVAHKWCFAELIGMKDGTSEYVSTTGGSAYHCDT